MNRLEQIEALFLELIECEPTERVRRLAMVSEKDDGMRGEVEELLAHHDSDRQFLSDGHLAAASLGIDLARNDRDATFPPNTQFGGYTILRTIGAGGMGVVYAARQDRPGRTVALKVIRSDLSSQSLVRRFEFEAELLGRLQHPGIAQIFEAGSADGGFGPQPFIAMELVNGMTITDFVAASELSPRGQLALFVKVCDAVHHAHQRGIVHRDLKPANILVVHEQAAPSVPPSEVKEASAVDLDGVQPKVLDFGIARATDADLQMTTVHTAFGQLIGTLPYMSPEQVASDPTDVDVRSDVYSLGVILYELLTGRLPCDVRNRPLPEALRLIREEEPVRLSTINRVFRGDIDTIVTTALNKDREKRYVTAAELASDIRCYLRGEPIQAKRDSSFYLLRRKLQRYRLAAAVTAGFLLLLIAFSVVSFRQWLRQEHLATEERELRRLADATSAQLSDHLRTSNIERGRLAGTSGDRRLGEELLWKEHVESPDSPETHWALWEFYANNPCLVTWRGHEGEVRSVAYSPDGKMLASYGSEGKVHLWRLPERELHASFDALPLKDTFGSIRFRPDGRMLAVPGPENTILLFDVDARRISKSLRVSTRRTGINYSRDGQLLGACGVEPGMEVCNPELEQCSSILQNNEVVIARVEFGPDGVIAGAGLDGTISLWKGPDDANPVVISAHADSVSGLAFTEDGKTLASGGRDRFIKLWDLTGPPAHLTTLAAPNGTIRHLRFTSGDRTLITSGWWTIDGWNVDLRSRIWSVQCSASASDVSPDGRQIATGHVGDLRLWDAPPTGAAVRLPPHTDRVAAVFSPDGKVVATGDTSRDVKLWDASSGTLIRTMSGHTARIKTLQYSPDGKRLATAAEDWTVKLWDPATGDCPLSFEGVFTQTAQAVAFSPDGRRLAVTSPDWVVTVRDVNDGAIQMSLPRAENSLLSVRYSPDGNTLITNARTLDILHWNAAGEPLRKSTVATCPWTLTYNADGKLFATGSWDGTVALYDVATGASQGILTGHTAVVYGVAFHPTDPTLLASCAGDGTVRLWHVPTRRNVLTFVPFQGWDLITVDFSPDGRKLVVAGAEGNVGIWDMTYHDRHIAGNADVQIARLGMSLGTARVAEWQRRIRSATP